MKHKWLGLLGAVAGLVFILSIRPAFAHHGTAAYDTSKQITVTGTVTEFDFVNPHTILEFTAKGEGGNTVKWQGELTSPNRLARAGWTRSTLKPGSEVTATGFPSKGGGNTIWIQKIVADGKELPLGMGD